MKKILLFILLFVVIIGCNSNEQDQTELQGFVALLSGTFSSSEQAKNESDYAKVHLVSKPIWSKRQGHWLYQELHDADNIQAIYYQRIINIKKIDSVTIITVSYKIPNATQYLNGWQNISIFDSLHPENLEIRNGCDIYYEKKTSYVYHGKTKDKSCLNSFGEETMHITSNLVISSDKISSWDRGYNMDGKQIWGKIQGPYKYKRISH